MKLHKFNFKNEAFWMLIINALPLIIAFLIVILLIAFPGV